MAQPATADAPAPPSAALPFVFARLSARQLCVCAAVSADWRRAAASELRRALRLDGEAAAGRALRALRRALVAPPLSESLEELSLEFARGVEDADVAAVAGPRTRSVNLNATHVVGDAAVLALAAACPRLESLSLYWNLRVSDAALAALAAAPCAATLQRLNLSGCKAVTDAGAASVARLPALRVLDLTRCASLRDGALDALAASPAAAQLEELVLYADAQFGEAALRGALGALAQGAKSLTRLDLCGAAALSDEALGALLPVQQQSAQPVQLALRELNLTWCPRLSDASLAPLLAACTQLRWLSLHGNTAVGTATLDALAAAAAPSLHTLDLRGCTSIPPQDRTPEALRRRMPRLRVFKVHS